MTLVPADDGRGDRARVVAVALSVCLAGCGGDGETVPPAPVGCRAGEHRADDGSCVAAGLPADMPCPPAEWLRPEDGVCVPAGVPVGACGAGFAHDGDRGCSAVLPAPCPPGRMAVPGETVCREIAACGSPPWGDIPVEPDSVYVDQSYVGISNGSAQQPWTTIQGAVNAAPNGAIVAIAAGSYAEDVSADGKSLRLWGRCPDLVEIVGSGDELATVGFYYAGSGASELRGLAIRGGAYGVFVSGALDVLLERVWVHDNADRGIGVQNDLGPTSLTLRASLVEQNHEIGVFVGGAALTVEGSIVRDTQPDPQGGLGWGVGVQPDELGGSSSLVLRGSVVERNRETGLFIGGTPATIEASVIRDNLPNTRGLGGRGMNVQYEPVVGVQATLDLRTSVIERNHEVALFVQGSDATIDATVIRDTQPNDLGLLGRGLGSEPDPQTGAPATVLLRSSLVDRNRELGVFIDGMELTMEASVVRNTQPGTNGSGGRGINVQAEETTKAPATLVVTSSLVEHNYNTGVFVQGSNATLEATIVREVQPDTSGGGRGVEAQDEATTNAPSRLFLSASIVEQTNELGVFVQHSEATIDSSVVRDSRPDTAGGGGRALGVQGDPVLHLPSILLMRASVIEQSHESGLFISGAEVTLVDSVIRGTLPRASDGGFGDAIDVRSTLAATLATLDGVRIEGSARGALAVFGASLRYGRSELSCQSFDLIGETLEAVPYAVEDLGGNLCGCPVAVGQCMLQTAGFQAPVPVEPEQPVE